MFLFSSCPALCPTGEMGCKVITRLITLMAQHPICPRPRRRGRGRCALPPGASLAASALSEKHAADSLSPRPRGR